MGQPSLTPHLGESDVDLFKIFNHNTPSINDCRCRVRERLTCSSVSSQHPLKQVRSCNANLATADFIVSASMPYRKISSPSRSTRQKSSIISGPLFPPSAYSLLPKVLQQRESPIFNKGKNEHLQQNKQYPSPTQKIKTGFVIPFAPIHVTIPVTPPTHTPPTPHNSAPQP